MDRQSRRSRAPAAEGLSEEHPVRRVGARRRYVERRQAAIEAASAPLTTPGVRSRGVGSAFGKGLKVQAIRKAGRPSLDGLWGGDASERSSRKLKSSLLPKRSRGSASLQQSQHAAGGRKQRGVGVGEAEQLKPERKAAVLNDGKRDRGNAEHRARN